MGSHWVDVEKGIIKSINPGEHKSPDVVADGTLIPGFVDIHCHGGGGYYFSAHSDQQIQVAIDAHKSAGTTSVMASLVTESIEDLKEQIQRLVPFYHRGEILGIHLEGPYLSHAKCGAHEPTLLLEPRIEDLKELLDLGQGAIKLITIAPEITGAIEAIKYLTLRGVKVALGHTDGGFKDVAAGTGAGATIFTHFMNAMNKETGQGTISAFVLADDQLMPELIVDGHHLSFDLVSDILTVIGSRCILVSDAMAAAGSVDGNYTIGRLPVIVKDGVARLADSQKLAGSTLTISQAFTNTIIYCGLSLVDAVAISSTNAAKALGLSDRGTIAIGMRADLLSFDLNSGKISVISE